MKRLTWTAPTQSLNTNLYAFSWAGKSVKFEMFVMGSGFALTRNGQDVGTFPTIEATQDAALALV